MAKSGTNFTETSVPSVTSDPSGAGDTVEVKIWCKVTEFPIA